MPESVLESLETGKRVEALQYLKWDRGISIAPTDQGTIMDFVPESIIVKWDKYPNEKLAVYLPKDINSWPIRVLD